MRTMRVGEYFGDNFTCEHCNISFSCKKSITTHIINIQGVRMEIILKRYHLREHYETHKKIRRRSKKWRKGTEEKHCTHRTIQHVSLDHERQVHIAHSDSRHRHCLIIAMPYTCQHWHPHGSYVHHTKSWLLERRPTIVYIQHTKKNTNQWSRWWT